MEVAVVFRFEKYCSIVLFQISVLNKMRVPDIETNVDIAFLADPTSLVLRPMA